MSGFLSNSVGRLKAALLASGGAVLIGFIHNAVGAVKGMLSDRLKQRVLLWDFLTDAQRADVLAGTGALDCTAALQAAIDHGAGLYAVANGYARKGIIVEVPYGAIRFTSITRKNGVSIKGQGRYKTLFLMSLNGGIGFKCAAQASQLSAGNVYWLEDSDFSLIHNPAVTFNAPTILWDMTGFTRCVWRNISLAFGGNVTAVSMRGATLAGSGGPSQWYNDFYSVYCEGDGTGGVGWDLGDKLANKEQITTWNWYSGRTGGTSGVGMKLNAATGCNLYGHCFEGLTQELLVGSPDGARGCRNVGLYGCYFEGVGAGYVIYPNAVGTQIFGGFFTGVANTDNGGLTDRLATSEWQIWVDNLVNSFRLRMVSASFKPQVSGTTNPGWRLINADGNWLDISNGAADGSTTDYFRVDDIAGRVLMKAGSAKAQIFAPQLSLGNQSFVGIFQGAGSPEGLVTAGAGSLYMRTDGGTGTSLYVKQTQTLATGWVAK